MPTRRRPGAFAPCTSLKFRSWRWVPRRRDADSFYLAYEIRSGDANKKVPRSVCRWLSRILGWTRFACWRMRGHGRRTPAPHVARGHYLGSSARVRGPGIVAAAFGARGVRALRLARRAWPAEGDGVPQVSPAIAAPRVD